MDGLARIIAVAKALAARAADQLTNDGLRRFAPVVGSVTAHGMMLVAIGVLIGAANTRPDPLPPTPPPEMSVTLVSNVSPPPPRTTSSRQTPSTAAPALPSIDKLPETAPAVRDRRRGAQNSAPEAPAVSAGSASVDAEILPPARTGVPLGLRSLLEKSPCSQVIVRLRGDCDSRWAALAEQGGLTHSPTLDELAAMFPGFQLEEPDNPFWMPKAPERLTRKPSLAGGRVMGPMGVMPSGVAGAGGPSDSVGRLPPKSDWHADPAFEMQPQWLGRD
jgi:hypothetical protein